MQTTTAAQTIPKPLLFARHSIGLGIVALANPLIYYDQQPIGMWLTTCLGPIVLALTAYGLYAVFLTERAKNGWPKSFFMLTWVLMGLFLLGQWSDYNRYRAPKAEPHSSAPGSSWSLAWPSIGQKLPAEYQPRVTALRKAAETGALSIVNIRPPSASDGALVEWPSNEVATIENQQTWWIADDVVGIHVDNRSMRKIGMIEIKHAPSECAIAADSSFIYYSLPLERPVESATQAIIQFRSGDQIPQANGCLIVTRIRG